MSQNIEINNLTALGVNEDFLRGVAKIVLEGENKTKEKISIVFVGQGRMRELNRRYRGKNKTTDVLAFPSAKNFTGKFKKEIKKIVGLGEVVICLREVKKNAKRYKLTFEKELAKILIHGILHLLGYNHKKGEKEAKLMEEREQDYLLKIGEIGEGSGEPFGSPV